jgi:hypothetical protein
VKKDLPEMKKNLPEAKGAAWKGSGARHKKETVPEEVTKKL